MASYVAIPKLGMAMTEATVIQWLVAEGAHVDRGDVVLTIETDKTNWDIEASAPGWLHVLVPPDETVPVGRVVGLLAESEVELSALQGQPAREIMTTGPALGAAEESAPATSAPDTPTEPGRRKDVRVSPVARKIAEENGLESANIVASGPDGRIVRDDVERALAERAVAAMPSSAAGRPPAAAGSHDGKRIAATIPLKGMRRSIAEHMQRSLAISAQLTYMGEADMGEAVALRNQLLAHEREVGAHITFNDILVVAVARALRSVPILNASLVGDEVVVWDDINVGVAVALERGLEGGLIVPVVRNADRKSLREVSTEVASLVEKARSGRLLPDDVAGGTFTVTNLATVAGGWFIGTPIINQPQSAIIATGAVSDRPVARNGQVVIRPIMPFSLTFDHRVVDGAPAAKFAARLVELLAEPALLLV